MGTGSSPSYWDDISESSTRVTFRFASGGEQCSDVCGCSGKYSSLIRNNLQWAEIARYSFIDPNEIPQPLQGCLLSDEDKKYWSQFAKEAKESAGTMPPPCRFLLLSFIWDVAVQTCYINKAKKQLRSLEEKHRPTMDARGIKIKYFDMSGNYSSSRVNKMSASASYGYHNVFGVFLDVIDPTKGPNAPQAMGMGQR